MIEGATSRTYTAPRRSGARRAAAHAGPAFALIYTMWFCVFFEPDWFLPSLIGGGFVFQKGVMVLALPALLVALAYGRRSDLYWPLLLFTVLHLTALPFSENRGLVMIGFIDMTRISILFTATVVLFDEPVQVLWLVKLFLLSFIWYGLQGIPSGMVDWHPTNANQDGFGGLMTLAIGIGYSVTASRVRRWRYLGYAGMALGVLGVVASFARGAVLAAALVLFLLWLRSRRKLVTLAAGIAAAMVLIPAVELLHPNNEFWKEMQTVTEGTSSGTGQDRKNWWTIALRVFREHPILGVGSHNTGVVASSIFTLGEIEGRYSHPSRMYSRAVHNTYLQLLAEQGLVGLGLWFVMLGGFARRLHRLRSPEMVAAWNRAMGGLFDLDRLTLGLELAMVAYLGGAFFYNETYQHWFYSLVLVAFLLDRAAARIRPRRRSKRSHPLEGRGPGAHPQGWSG